MKSYEVQKFVYIRIVRNWVNNPCYFTFVRLLRCGFRDGAGFIYRVYHIARNTVNGRYAEIAANGRDVL